MSTHKLQVATTAIGLMLFAGITALIAAPASGAGPAQNSKCYLDNLKCTYSDGGYLADCPDLASGYYFTFYIRPMCGDYIAP